MVEILNAFPVLTFLVVVFQLGYNYFRLKAIEEKQSEFRNWVLELHRENLTKLKEIVEEFRADITDVRDVKLHKLTGAVHSMEKTLVKLEERLRNNGGHRPGAD